MVKNRLEFVGNAKQLKDIFDAVSHVKEELMLKIDKDGLKITVMDLSHIALVELFIAKEDMDVFECEDIKNFGINLSDFVKYLKRRDNGEKTILNFEGLKLDIIFQNEQGKNRKFALPQLAIEEEKMSKDSLEEMEYENSFYFKFIDFKRILGDAEVLSDVLYIELKEDNLIFSAIGENDHTYENKYELSQLTNELYKDIKNVFGINFLNMFLKSGLIFGTAQTKAYKKAEFQMFLSEDLPVKMKVSLFNESYLKYFIAPRCEVDDEDDDF